MTPAKLLRYAALTPLLLVLACSEPEADAAVAPQAGGQPSSQASADGSPYEPAPDFVLTDIASGKPWRLSDQKGKVVLIDFWATWCGPCRMAIPHLIELQNEYGPKGFTLVGVSLDQQGEAVVRPFYKSWKLNYPVVLDPMGEVARTYGGIRSIPTYLLVDKQGRVVNYFMGYRPKAEFEKAIQTALAKS